MLSVFLFLGYMQDRNINCISYHKKYLTFTLFLVTYVYSQHVSG